MCMYVLNLKDQILVFNTPEEKSPEEVSPEVELVQRNCEISIHYRIT